MQRRRLKRKAIPRLRDLVQRLKTPNLDALKFPFEAQYENCNPNLTSLLVQV